MDVDPAYTNFTNTELHKITFADCSFMFVDHCETLHFLLCGGDYDVIYTQIHALMNLQKGCTNRLTLSIYLSSLCFLCQNFLSHIVP